MIVQDVRTVTYFLLGKEYMFFEGVIFKLCSNLNFTLYISVMNYLNDEIDTSHSPEGK